MSKATLRTLSAILVTFAFAGAGTARAEAKIMAGLARTEITPPVGGKMWGYAGRGVSTGVHDPLFAKVLVLAAGDTKVAIVSWEVCEFQSPRLRKMVAEMGIPFLLLHSTHTHGGPDLYQKDFPSPDKPWLATVEDRIAAAIREASSHMFPAYLSAAEGSIQLGYNRIHRERNGLGTTWFDNPERIPFGPVDPTVGLLRIKDDTGAVRALLVHYACHPVVLGPDNTLISADYPGPMTEKVEREIGGNAMCIFIQGGGGDINPLFMAREAEKDRRFEIVSAMGLQLAEEVISTLNAMDKGPGRSDDLRILSENVTAGHRWERDKKLNLGVASLLINSEIGIVAMPGEPFHLFQKELRRRAELPHTFFFGYTDTNSLDWPDYVPDIQSAAHAGYGASDTTSIAVGGGEQLLSVGLVQLYTMRGMFKDKPWRPPSR